MVGWRVGYNKAQVQSSQEMLKILKAHPMLMVSIILDSHQHQPMKQSNRQSQKSSDDGHGLNYSFCCYISVFTQEHQISHVQPFFFFTHPLPQKPKISSFCCVSSTGSTLSFLALEWLEAFGCLIRTQIFKVRYFLSFGCVGVCVFYTLLLFCSIIIRDLVVQRGREGARVWWFMLLCLGLELLRLWLLV